MLLRSRGSRSGIHRGNLVRLFGSGGLGADTGGPMNDRGDQMARFDGLTAGAPEGFCRCKRWHPAHRIRPSMRIKCDPERPRRCVGGRAEWRIHWAEYSGP